MGTIQCLPVLFADFKFLFPLTVLAKALLSVLKDHIESRTIMPFLLLEEMLFIWYWLVLLYVAFIVLGVFLLFLVSLELLP